MWERIMDGVEQNGGEQLEYGVELIKDGQGMIERQCWKRTD